MKGSRKDGNAEDAGADVRANARSNNNNNNNNTSRDESANESTNAHVVDDGTGQDADVGDEPRKDDASTGAKKNRRRRLTINIADTHLGQYLELIASTASVADTPLPQRCSLS